MQPPVIVFPDVELWACDYLKTALAARPESFADTVYVGVKVPDPRRDRMVIVRRDGGPRLDTVREAARLGVRVWATSEQDATDLARLVRALMWMAPDGSPVCRVNDLSGPSPVADESKQPLRFFSLELIVRGAPLDADLES
jgi:hypothetical protein